MNPAQLLAHFGRISDAPDSMPRLRQFILDLAVRGKLVEQNPRDEPASELLKHIQAEQTRCGRDAANKHVQLPLPTRPGERLSAIPDRWEWVRLASLLLEDSQNGYSKKPDEAVDGIPILRISAGTVRKDGIVAEEEHKLISGVSADQEKRFGLQSGDLLACRFNGNRSFVGRLSLYLGYLGIKPIYPDKLIRLRLVSLFVLPKLVKYFAESNVVRKDIESYCATTVGNWGISATNLKVVNIPLPPLAEQRRIVAKVDELMSLCDRLEAAQSERESRRDRMAAASLQRLNRLDDTDTPEVFREHAGFYLNHLPRLTTRPEHIKQVRQTILELAFRGRLTAHWREHRNQESAQDYCEEVRQARIHAWREKLKTGEKRKYSDPVDFDSRNLPTIPDSWVWSSGDAVCSQITDGEHIQPRYQAEGLPMLTATHVRDGYVTFEGCGLIAESDFQKCAARCRPEEGDVLIVSVGATTGRAAVVNRCRPFVLVRSVLLLKPLIPEQYFLRWLQSPWCFKWMGQASGATAQPHLYIGDTKRMPVPVPPLAEQHRIVARVDELMLLCDRLESHLATAQAESRRLLEAVLHEAITPAILQTL
jgi:type I restriction enzyme S subunit